MGVHRGEVLLRKNHPDDVALGAKPLEVEGVAKPTAARVMSVARGGQTLMTQAARAHLTTQMRVESHGHWRMKGVAQPLELFEVGEQDGAFIPPPDGAKVYRVVRRQPDGMWVPVHEIDHSLPAERDPFVGRGEDLDQLDRLLGDGARLVSVLGLGGTGKTRMSIHYGWTWLGDWPGGVWFCDLSEARSLEGAVQATASGLRVAAGSFDPVGEVGSAIAEKGECLVILDNFEQIARHARDTVGRWLDQAADARFVVTTREVLGVRGEVAFALPPLPSNDAADLFLARARQAKRGFEVDDPATVNALVELLDGLPLAIELAAARVRVMPPKTLLERMSQRFRLLAASGGRHTRQATLRATLDWSWDLLPSDEQAALAQLSVFEGGVDLEAAEAVLVLGDAWPVDAVQALVDKSLVRQVDGERFDLLVSVQEYAQQRLAERSDEGATKLRHAEFYAQLISGEPGGAVDIALSRRLSRELDNLLSASRRMLEQARAQTALATLRTAWQVLSKTGPADIALELARAGLALNDSDTAPGFHRIAGLALDHRGDLDAAQAECEAAAQGFGASGRVRDEALALDELGILAFKRGDFAQARSRMEASLERHTRLGNHVARGGLLSNLGAVCNELGDNRGARAYYEQALDAHRSAGNTLYLARTLGNLGLVDLQDGDPAGALNRLRHAQDLFEQLDDKNALCSGSGMICGALIALGRTDEALEELERGLGYSENADRRTRIRMECDRASVLGHLNRDDEAFRLLQEVRAEVEQMGDPVTLAQVHQDLGRLAYRADQPGDAAAHYARALALASEVGASWMEADILLWQHRDRRQHAGQSLPGEGLERARVLFESAGRSDGLASVWLELAWSAHLLGDSDGAAAALGRAHEPRRGLGSRSDSAGGLPGAGVLDRTKGS